MSRIDQVPYFIQGHREIPQSQPNRISLVIRVGKVKKLCKPVGFEVVDTGTSYKRAPDGYPKVRGRQNYVTVVKEQ